MHLKGKASCALVFVTVMAIRSEIREERCMKHISDLVRSRMDILRLESDSSYPRAYARWLGLNYLYYLILQKKVFVITKEISCVRILFGCYFVDLTQIPRNKISYKYHGTL